MYQADQDEEDYSLSTDDESSTSKVKKHQEGQDKEDVNVKDDTSKPVRRTRAKQQN